MSKKFDVTLPIRMEVNGDNVFVCGYCGEEFRSKAVAQVPFPICGRHE